MHTVKEIDQLAGSAEIEELASAFERETGLPFQDQSAREMFKRRIADLILRCRYLRELPRPVTMAKVRGDFARAHELLTGCLPDLREAEKILLTMDKLGQNELLEAVAHQPEGTDGVQRAATAVDALRGVQDLAQLVGRARELAAAQRPKRRLEHDPVALAVRIAIDELAQEWQAATGQAPGTSSQDDTARRGGPSFGSLRRFWRSSSPTPTARHSARQSTTPFGRCAPDASSIASE